MRKVKSQSKPLIGTSLFSSAGIAEQYFSSAGIDIVSANELLPERANLYQAQYPNSKMICGDILNTTIFQTLVDSTPEKLDFLIASPPCQGMSVAGKNRTIEQMLKDDRNFLVFKIIEFIKIKNPDFILIENVPTFLKLELPFNGELMKIIDILNAEFGGNYNIDPGVYDASDYGVPQRRTRAIIKLYKKGEKWGNPEKSKIVTVREAISDLPCLEAGEKSNIKWHFARKHSEKHINCMRHTPTGKSAIENSVHFPIKENGERVKAYKTTFRRINWDEPAPTITMRNDAISSQLNVHPGRPKSDGTYSDARVLTPLELMLLSSLPADWNIPDNTPELLIRKCIGECIPPLLTKKIVEQINK
ncbi:DNA cytosine methyltransferase [Bacteroidales bacterium OttesenSCG-928-B11]|nr:DNA cytosine methyltransferase [Bacteroidales bacterium OttesenSCG-928-C03]MDL2311879.1 DNA cytosine methyltransferase [Bacteroidales bacterium OttesenSCG-928-B11]MDL2326164.1 DNA cytosine methyltransferase [Bacteroidales bacterium OttesenSCG-928-A14]